MINEWAMWALMSIDTGGGPSVGRNVETGQDFVGRDTADHRNYLNIDFGEQRNYQRTQQSLEDRVMDLERLVYGEPRWGEPGLIKRQQRQLSISLLNLGLNVAGTLALLILLFSLWKGG